MSIIACPKCANLFELQNYKYGECCSKKCWLESKTKGGNMSKLEELRKLSKAGTKGPCSIQNDNRNVIVGTQIMCRTHSRYPLCFDDSKKILAMWDHFDALLDVVEATKAREDYSPTPTTFVWDQGEYTQKRHSLDLSIKRALEALEELK